MAAIRAGGGVLLEMRDRVTDALDGALGMRARSVLAAAAGDRARLQVDDIVVFRERQLRDGPVHLFF